MFIIGGIVNVYATLHSLLIAIPFAIILCSCGTKPQTADSGTELYVTAISPVNIERFAPIAVSFTHEIICEPEDALSFSPRQKGTWEIINSKTAVFTPSAPYPSGKPLVLSADCAKLFGKTQAQGIYRYTFLIDSPSYEIVWEPLQMDTAEKTYSLEGILTTDIPVAAEAIGACIQAFTGSGLFKTKYPISWEQDTSGKIWKFLIKNIGITNKTQRLSVVWQGKKLGLSRKQDKVFSGTKSFTIPAKDEFSIIDINTSKRNTISISFSQFLDSSQDIQSFVSAQDTAGNTIAFTNVTIRNNVLTLYNDSNWQDVQNIHITTGIKSTKGIYLASTKDIPLSNHWELPSVRFMTKGTILPSSQGTVLPIETRNVTGVLIQAYAIYDHNILQFLQVNDLDTNHELYRVGEPVWTQSVSFDWDISMQNRYIPRGIDMSALVKKYPHGMFQIRLSFRKKHIKYREATDQEAQFAALPMPPDTISEDTPDNESSSWDYWEDMDWEEQDSFWSYKKNPYHPAFYIPRFNSDSLIKRNILISDIGIMAKKTADNRLYITIADIKTAQPISGADISCYSFVGTKINQQRSDKNGTVVFEDSSKIPFIAASYKDQTSYLKIGNGTGLSVSHFETGGEKTVNGVKGFIYGERGVWRPGDTLYLTFVLQDLQNSLPAHIPVRFELSDPLGRVTETRTLTESVNGFYPIETKTAIGAPTGLWQAKISIGGQEWTQALRIETVIPNRLAIKLQPEKTILTSGNNRFTLSGAWLHGAPTPNYAADIAVFFTATREDFGYPDYTFSNPSISMPMERSDLWSGQLDSSSQITFTETLTAGMYDPVPGKLKAHFISRIFEPSGSFSIAQSSFPYSPYKQYIGLRLPKGDATRGMLLTDVKHTADILLLDANGQPVPSGNLSYAVHKLEWKWWWEKDALTNAGYVSSQSQSLIESGSLAIKNGKGNFQFEVKYPDWGRYLITVSDDNNGHSAAKVVYIDWPGWAGRAQENSSGSAAMVTLITDKQQYTVNETANISFASSAGNRALITVEKNGTIIQQEWIETAKNTTVYKLPLTEAMAPNVYVHITLLQQHLQTANSLPIRLYGVVPVMVDNPATQLIPVITTPSEYSPNNNAVITVSEQNGKPMTFTLAVVDEGLLGLTNFHGPELRKEFYKKEASQLTSWDIYQYVMNAYSGKLETLLAIGGGEDGTDSSKREANRFKPVVKYFGPFTLTAGEKKQLSFTMPEYIGAVRAIAVAGSVGAYGLAEKTIPVKADLMIQAALPRTIGTNETIEVPVTVFNGTNTMQFAKINFTAQGALPSLSSEKLIKIPATENTTVNFTIKTTGIGTGTFTASVKTDKNFAQTSESVQIQSRGIPIVQRTHFTLKPTGTSSVSVDNPTEAGSTKLSMELSSVPSLNLASRLDYLITYPHGCIEQITSGAFPQLYLTDFTQLTVKEKERIQRHIASVIERYPQYQTASGGVSYWPGSSVPSAWGSSYVLHFLIEARKKGYTVPSSLLDPLVTHLTSTAADWTSSEEDTEDIQAYRLFVLALAGKADIGAMNRLKNGKLNSSSSMLLAAAYTLAGRKDTAKDLVWDLVLPEETYRYTGGSFGSSFREQAIHLMISTLIDNRIQADKSAQTVSAVLSSDEWCSTQETAWLLFSLLSYYHYQKQTAGSCSYTLTANNETRTEQLTHISKIEELPVGQTSVQRVNITNTGKQTLYGILTASGMSVAGTERLQNDGLSLSVSYFSTEGTVIHPHSLKRGDSFIVETTITNKLNKKIENIALTMPLPTCWEISNDRISLDEEYESASYSYQDIRDDAVHTYFDLRKNETVSYRFYATAAYQGSYFIPAIHAQAMYDNNIRAVYPGLYVADTSATSR